jgi:hypothetical protein
MRQPFALPGLLSFSVIFLYQYYYWLSQ